MSDPFFDEFLDTSPSRKSSTTKPTASPVAVVAPTQPTAATNEVSAAASLPASAPAVSAPVKHATVYAEFKVLAAVQGSEMLKPLTYFPISVSLHMPPADDPAVKAFTCLPAAPHHRECAALAGQRRNRWEGDPVSQIQRRYSELVDFRSLLVLQYPMLVIPPLVPKSTSESFNTFMQSEGHLRQQQRNVKRFLRELGRMPEIMLYNDLVPNFFQYPREKFYEWMSRIRETSNSLKRANASIEEHRPKRKAPGGGDAPSTMETMEDAVSNLATESTKIVRGFMGALSSWVSTPATGSSAAASKDRESMQAKTEQLFQEHPQAQFWADRLVTLADKRTALTQAAELLLKFLAADDDANQALSDVAEAINSFATNLETAECFTKTHEAAAKEAALIRDIADIHRTDPDKRFTQLYEELLFEANYMEAMEDAIEFVRCLWRRKIENDLDRYLGPSIQKDYQQYVSVVDGRLKDEVARNWLRHVHRMKVIMKKMADIPLASLHEEEKKCAIHPFIVLCRTEAYSVFE